MFEDKNICIPFYPFRYEKYWIPFILYNSPSYETDLDWLPPLDVHWAWHVHMLAPRVYTRDLLGSPLQRIINHRPLDVLGEEAAKKRAKTAAKWGEAFPGVSFEPDLQTLTLNDDFKSPFSYDIISASARQKVFYYQVNIFCNGSWKEQMLWCEITILGFPATLQREEIFIDCHFPLCKVLISETEESRQVSCPLLWHRYCLAHTPGEMSNCMQCMLRHLYSYYYILIWCLTQFC